MCVEVRVDQPENVLYLIVKRPDSISKWKGSRLLEFQTNQKVMNKIEKYRTERLFVKGSSKRDILCSVIVDTVVKNEDGTYLITFKDIREDHWVLPGAIKSFAGGFAEGPPPIPVPLH
ncbi:MAG: hypothetical protein HC883_03795 [Bdellovibrionaceae bacterium]|nr:hypothetical protein [Pseudobdellovibrionaceae bacterium]